MGATTNFRWVAVTQRGWAWWLAVVCVVATFAAGVAWPSPAAAGDEEEIAGGALVLEVLQGVAGINREVALTCPSGSQELTSGNLVEFADGSTVELTLNPRDGYTWGEFGVCVDPSAASGANAITVHRLGSCAADVIISGVGEPLARHSSGVVGWANDRLLSLHGGFVMSPGSYREVRLERSGSVSVDAECNVLTSLSLLAGNLVVGTVAELLGAANEMVTSVLVDLAEQHRVCLEEGLSGGTLGRCLGSITTQVFEWGVGAGIPGMDVAKAGAASRKALPLLLILSGAADGVMMVNDVVTFDIRDTQATVVRYEAAPDIVDFDAAAHRGRIVTTPDDRSYYLDRNGWLHHVPDQQVFACHGADANRIRVLASALEPLADRHGEPASCTTATAGQIAVHEDGHSHLVVAHDSGGLARRPIPSANVFDCLVAQGHDVVRGVPRYRIDEWADVGAATAVCVPDVDGMVVTTPDSSWSALISGGVKHPILSGGAYLCLTLWSGVAVYPTPLAADQIRQFTPGSAATCSEHIRRTAGKIVRAVDGGHSVFVDAAGVAHNIETRNAFVCLTDVGVQVLDVPDHRWQQAFAFGADQPGCEKVLRSSDGSSYRELPDGRLLEIVDTQSFYCYADRLPGHRVVSVAASVIVSMGVDGTATPCLSAGRYEGKIVRDNTGRAGIVLGGVWRSIPDGHSWSCYRAKGYPIGEYATSPTHVNSLTRGARLGYCLNRADYRSVLVEQAGGHWFMTSSSGCAYAVGNGWTYEALRFDRRIPVRATGLNAEHINSLGRCGTHAWLFSTQSFRNTLIRRASDGAVFWVSPSGCRYHVRDWYTVERREQQGYRFKHWTASNSEVASLPYCGLHGFMLATWRVENKVVRGPDGTSWFVRGGEWFWIPSGSLWWHLVRRYGLASGTYSYTWQHIDSIKYDRGRWAQWW